MLARSLGLTLVLASAACSVQISDGRAPVASAPDGGGGATDAGTPPVAMCTRRTLFLNFGGVTLTQGASDATLDRASWLQNATGTAPRYRSGSATRDDDIRTIVDRVTAQLAQFPIKVVTARPTSGNYVMVVFGGTASQVGSRFGAAVTTLDCGDTRPNDVAWIADNLGLQRAANTAVGAVGFGLGLTATTDTRDCMCGWDNGCQSDNSVACTLGAPIARDPAANQLCAGAGASQDEAATFRAAFCN